MAEGVKKTQGQHLDETEELEIVEMTIPEVKKALREGKLVQAVHTAVLYAFVCECE